MNRRHGFYWIRRVRPDKTGLQHEVAFWNGSYWFLVGTEHIYGDDEVTVRSAQLLVTEARLRRTNARKP
jgi:hypothetical protein